MKQVYSPRLISSFLISAAMLFNSCTKDKETIQSLKAYDEARTMSQEQVATTIKDTPGHQHKAQTASAYNRTDLQKPICCWTNVIGGSISVPAPTSLCFSAKVLTGPDKTKLYGNLYREEGGAPYPIGSFESGYDNSGVSGMNCIFIAIPNNRYYVRIQCGDEHSFVPHFDDINKVCYINFPKTGVIVSVWFW